MAEKVFFQESKEYQLKVDMDRCFGNAPRVPGSTDEAIFKAVVQAMRQAVESLAEGGKSKVEANDNLWRRDGIRYDTAKGQLKANKLTIGVEAADKRTKFKFKQHDFVPEMLFDKPENAMVLPDIRKSSTYKKHDTTLKLEQDLHLDNIKYCASGSLYVKGHQTDVEDTSFFSPYYPGLLKLFPKPVALKPVSHWDEAIFDDMSVSWGHNDIDTWMLVNRWDAKTKEFLEAELSFKVIKRYEDDWDYHALREAARLYLALRKTGLFKELPPIFTFSDPVSSIDIERIPEEAMA